MPPPCSRPPPLLHGSPYAVSSASWCPSYWWARRCSPVPEVPPQPRRSRPGACRRTRGRSRSASTGHAPTLAPALGLAAARGSRPVPPNRSRLASSEDTLEDFCLTSGAEARSPRASEADVAYRGQALTRQTAAGCRSPQTWDRAEPGYQTRRAETGAATLETQLLQRRRTICGDRGRQWIWPAPR